MALRCAERVLTSCCPLFYLTYMYMYDFFYPPSRRARIVLCTPYSVCNPARGGVEDHGAHGTSTVKNGFDGRDRC